MEFSDPVQTLFHFCTCVRRAVQRAQEDLRTEQRPEQLKSVQFQARDLKGMLRRAQRRLRRIEPVVAAVRQAIATLEAILAETLALVENNLESMAPTSPWVAYGLHLLDDMLGRLAPVEATLRPRP
jgi:hypothetical protein